MNVNYSVWIFYIDYYFYLSQEKIFMQKNISKYHWPYLEHSVHYKATCVKVHNKCIFDKNIHVCWLLLHKNNK